MKKTLYIIIFSLLLSLYFFGSGVKPRAAVSTPETNTWWDIQSVDTMKYSRDLARQGLKDAGFPEIIDQQVTEIASAGATHIAIGTPYDEEFLPFLKQWVDSARIHHLHIWFRGNWAGWEGWFGYSGITRTEHLSKTKQFILDNPDLFADGDIFTACPECENGGPGDPRQGADVENYRQFLLDEYLVVANAFAAIHKNVRSNLFSMNADVARLVMNKGFTTRLGGIITIDHYVKDPGQYAADIDDLVKNTGAKIMLGEFGAPIPDITGKMTPEEQAGWLQNVLDLLAARRENIIGINYWVSVGGSTGIWDGKGNASPAVSVLHDFFIPGQKISLQVKNDLRRAVASVPVSWFGRVYLTDSQGRVEIPYVQIRNNPGLLVGGNNSGFKQVTILATPSAQVITVTITPVKQNILYRINKFFVQLFNIR